MTLLGFCALRPSTARAQTATAPEPQVAAIQYVKSHFLPEGNMVFDSRIPVPLVEAPQKTWNGRHAQRETAAIAKGIDARVADADSVVQCDSTQRNCLIVDASSVVSSAIAIRAPQQVEVTVRSWSNVALNSGNRIHLTEYTVLLEKSAGSWTVTSAKRTGQS